MKADNNNLIISDITAITGRMMHTAVTVVNIYEILLYVACLSSSGTGAFLSVSGTAEYFDMVIGSYHKKRFGVKGGKRIWDYSIPSDGELLRTEGIWLYKDSTTRWLTGIETSALPDKSLLKNLHALAFGSVGFVKENEMRVEGRDFLTGLFNRGRFYRDANHLIDVFSRNGKNLFLFFIDINNFKAINDTLGHDMGDRVLQSQAFIITRIIGDSGMVYRYGGDEFCALLPGVNEITAKTLSRRLEIASEQAPGGVPVSASVGIALYNKGEDLNGFVSRADKEMYTAKENHKKENTKGAESGIHL